MNRQHAALIDRLDASGRDLVWYLGKLSEQEIHAVPAPNEWSIHQVMAHLRDTEQQVFLFRAQRILSEDHPAVPNFDQEAWHRDHYSASEPLKKILSDYRAARRKLVGLLRRTRDKDWTRWAMHPEYRKISLDWLVTHDYNHTMEHLAQIGSVHEKSLLKQLNA